MKFSEHHPKDIRTNNVGATYDIDRELSGAENKGTYFDSENGRVSGDNGTKSSWKKIKGEVERYSTQVAGDWFSMCSMNINDDKVEIIVEKDGLDTPCIIVNGQIMGKSADMPWLYAHRIQSDKNESCLGGEFFLTDFNVPPMIFNLKDIKDNFTAGTQKYFNDFNPDLYYTNLGTPLDIPIFTELVNLGGGGGLPVSSNQYSLRYVNEDGDATNWGPLTPAISVPQSNSTASSQYPSIKTFGGPADLGSTTSYGIKIRFRITNLNNYDYIEIRRIQYAVGGGLDYVPQGSIVAKIPVLPGEISIRDFVDPRDSNVEEGVLADNEEAGQLTAIEKAKAIRYYDKRLVLMNYETPSKVAELNFLEYNGKKIFPVVEGLGRAGHSDPVANTYKKNYPSGEKFSFAINLFDGLGGSGFVVEDDDLKNVQVPNRRDPMDSDSQDLSPDSVSAADVNSVVSQTFEVFDTSNAVQKTDVCTFKNILKKGEKFVGPANLNDFCSDAGFGNEVESEEIGYKPYRPTDKNDSTDGHNYVVNPQILDDGEESYNPRGFGCDYFSKGFALGGLSNFPSWSKSFSIVKSERAGRIVCQGIGMYSLNKGDFNTFGNSAAATKETNKLWFTSPDIVSGVVSQDVLDDIQSNPQNYSIQLVSPLGFFSEVYNFEQNTFVANRDRLIDMVTYARVIRDSGQINPGEDPTMGVNGYVAYNRYRNNNNAGQGAFNTPDGGNTVLSLSGFSSTSSGRSSYYELETFASIYNVGGTGGTGNNDFQDQGMKDFTEPFYIVNIIRTGAEVQDLNINSYYLTGHYQKLSSIIGEGDGTANQSFVLVDERWEDCIPSLTPTGFNFAGESFVYLVDEQQNEIKCLNVTYETPANIFTIMTDITNNGFYVTPGGANVQGIYTHSQDANGDIFINFNTGFTVPSSDYKVIVKYDNSRPIRFFGGDTVVGENIFAPIDLESDASLSNADEQFDFNIGFPFRRWKINPRHYIVRKTTGVNRIQNADTCRLGYLRQLCVMYAAESVSSSPLSFNLGGQLDFFPLTHYVMRPNRWSESEFGSGNITDIADDNNMYEDYFQDYPEEYTIWKYGGFRFSQQFNLDYSVKGPQLYFSKPKVGFDEENKFCTGIVWSLPRAINQQDSPGLKTFPGTNRYLAADNNGEIKKAWDCRTGGKGDNLYAVMESGIALLLTKKAILSNLTADDLSVTASDQFISDVYWISKTIGSDGEMWRGMAEGSVEFNSDGGKVEVEALFIPNKHSVYRLAENQLEDILKDKYHTRLSPSLISFPEDYSEHMTGLYNKRNNEYWLQMRDVNTDNLQRCFVHSCDTNYWVGRFHYMFDNYLFMDSVNYGFRGGDMFELEQGFIINGNPIEASLIQFTSVNIAEEKEAIAIEINTGPRGTMKPTEIKFMDEDLNVLSRLNASLFGPMYLKQYSGWWNQIPRKEDVDPANRERIQYRLILWEILHNFEEDFKVVSSVIQYKPLK